LAIDYGSAEELAEKADKVAKAIETANPAMWKALRNQGIFMGRGRPELVAFLYTGQGSQYVNMLDTLRHSEPIVGEMFDEADRIMEPILGRPLTDYIFADPSDENAMAAADAELRQTEITQPAVLAVDAALTEMLAAYGIQPDMVMGHSLGEYGALVASKALPFEDALEAVAGRGREMANVEVPDTGLMAAVFAPIEDVQRVVESVDDYVGHRKRKQLPAGGHRRFDTGGRRGRPHPRRGGSSSGSPAGQPRLSHRDRCAGQRTVERPAGSAAAVVARHPPRCQHRR